MQYKGWRNPLAMGLPEGSMMRGTDGPRALRQTKLHEENVRALCTFGGVFVAVVVDAN